MVGGDGGWVGNLGDVVLLTTFEAATGVVPHHNIPFSAVMDQVTAALSPCRCISIRVRYFSMSLRPVYEPVVIESSV